MKLLLLTRYYRKTKLHFNSTKLEQKFKFKIINVEITVGINEITVDIEY